MAEEFNITKHSLVPEHIILKEDEKKSLLENYNLNINQFPMILQSDAAITHLNPQIGDIVKIIRDSPTNDKQIFYRVVVHG
jgi:DNA-directed RNA polymerase subunit H